MTNCVFSGNLATGSGGGIHNQSGGSVITMNCTIAGNTANNNGGGAYSNTATSTFQNCIVWGNNSGIDAFSSTMSVTYSIVQGSGVYPGTGNLNADPLFCKCCDPDGADNISMTSDDGLALQGISPAINTASASGATTTTSLVIQEWVTRYGCL
jgi:predicted outer membrane repeat protein